MNNNNNNNNADTARVFERTVRAYAADFARYFGRTFSGAEEIAGIIRDTAAVDDDIRAAVESENYDVVADWIVVWVLQNIVEAEGIEPMERITAAAELNSFRWDWVIEKNLKAFLKEREGLENEDDPDAEAIAEALKRGEIGGYEFPARAEDLGPLLPDGMTALALTEAGQDWTGSGIPAENCRADAADILEGQAADSLVALWAEAMNRDGDVVAVAAEALADAYDRRAETERWALAEGFAGDDLIEELAEAFAGEFEAGDAEALEAAEASAAAVEGERARLAAYYERMEEAAAAI